MYVVGVLANYCDSLLRVYIVYLLYVAFLPTCLPGLWACLSELQVALGGSYGGGMREWCAPRAKTSHRLSSYSLVYDRAYEIISKGEFTLSLRSRSPR